MVNSQYGVAVSQKNIIPGPLPSNRMLSGDYEPGGAGVTGNLKVIPEGQTWGIDGEARFHGVSLVNLGNIQHHSEQDGPGRLWWPDGIDNSTYIGGGVLNPENDIGFWTMEHGVYDFAGSPLECWNTAGDDPTWRNGHELWLAPTGHYANIQWTPFQRGSQVPLQRDGEPSEVINATRDLQIWGPGGPTHQTAQFIHIHNTSDRRPINYSFVEERFCGVPNFTDRGSRGWDNPGLLGRYGLHHHMVGDATRGLLVEGCVIIDSGNKTFVPHSSHGIYFKDCASLRSWSSAFWWDHQRMGAKNLTDDIAYDHCIAGEVNSGRSLLHNASGFSLVQGTGNICINCVIAGVDGHGYSWPEFFGADDPTFFAEWDFGGEAKKEHIRNVSNVVPSNRAHHVVLGGVRVWQNVFDTRHEVPVVVTTCDIGIDAGAYGTPGYHYGPAWLHDCRIGINQHAQGSGTGQLTEAGKAREDDRSICFEDIVITGSRESAIYMTNHNAGAGSRPALYKRVNAMDPSNAARIICANLGQDSNFPGKVGFYDFVQSFGIGPDDIQIKWPGVHEGTRYRFQDGDRAVQALRVNGAWQVSNIDLFYDRSLI